MPGDTFTPLQLGQHILGPEPMEAQHDQCVKPEIGGFPHDMQFITLLPRQQSLGRLLADLLEDRVVALGKQLGHIG